MTDQEPPVDDVQKALLGTGNAGPYSGTTASGDNPKYQEFKHRRDKERDADAERKVDEQSKAATEEYNKDPVVQTARTKIQDAQATRTEEEAAEVEDAENAHVDNVFQDRARAAEEARIKNVRENADAEAKARANQNTVDPFQNSNYVAPTEDEVAERKGQQIKDRDEYNDQVFQDEQERKAAEEERRKAEEEAKFYEENDPNKEGTLDPKGQSARDWQERQRQKIEEGREGMGPGENLEDMAERQRRDREKAEYDAMVHSDDPNVRLKTAEGLVNERNDLAKQHMAKMVNAFAQTAAEMGGQMASKGWDLAGNIVKMTFTQPHAMSSSSRLIGTAMGALQTAGDFADRSMEKYKIDANADPNLMKNTIRYKLYKREAQMGKNTVGNTFRAISESLGNMGLQDASQMTPDQLDQHVADMQAEVDRLTQASKDPKLSAMDRSLIKAQADHLQGYMAGLGKQGATMAQNQRMAARRQKRQDLATRRQNYQTLADGSPNPYKEALEWADPRFGIEVDPQTGRPTNPSAYNRMLNAVIAQHQNEVAAAGGKLDPAREKWFNDLQNKIHNDIQAMKQDKAENPLRGRAEIYARIGRVAPGFEKYIDNIEKTGTFPSNSTQSTRAIRKVLADYLFELEKANKDKTPEYNHARALLTAMDKYNNMKKLMSRIAGLMPNGAERAQRIHQEAEDPYAGLDYSDNGKINDYTALVQLYANLMKVLPRDPKGGAAFNPDDPAYKAAESRFNDNLTYYINKWFPGAGWSVDNNYDDEDTDEGGDEGGSPGVGTPGGETGRSLEDFSNDDDENDPNEEDDFYPEAQNPYEWWVERQKAKVKEQVDPESGDDIDQFIAEVLQRISMGEPFEEETPQPENPNPAPQPPPEGPSPQPPEDPRKGDRKANARFRATFPETNQIQLRERLHQLGFEFDGYGMVTDPQKYQDFKDQFLKLGVGENEFNKKFGRMMPLRMRSFAEQVYIARKQLAFGPEGAQNSLGATSVKGARLNSFLVNNPDMAELMSKKLWGEPLTEEEELSVQKALFDAGLIKRIKTRNGDVPPAEETGVPAEEEEQEDAEQPQLTVTENDFIKPEVASQFKDPQSIESINNGLAEIANATSNAGAARAYDDVLWGLTNEIGDDALLSDEYKSLMDNALSEGSDRAFQIKANAAQDPDEKLMYLMARASLAQDLSSSQQSKDALDAFLKSNAAKYDYDAVKKIVKNNEDTFLKVKSREDGTAFINKMLSTGLDPSVKLNKEDETPVDEEGGEGNVAEPIKTRSGKIVDVSKLSSEYQDALNITPRPWYNSNETDWNNFGEKYFELSRNLDSENEESLNEFSDFAVAFAKKFYDSLGDDPKKAMERLLWNVNGKMYTKDRYNNIDELMDDIELAFYSDEDVMLDPDLTEKDKNRLKALSEQVESTFDKYYNGKRQGTEPIPSEAELALLIEFAPDLMDLGLWQGLGGSPDRVYSDDESEEEEEEQEGSEEPEEEAPVNPNSTEAFEGGDPELKGLEDRVNKEYQKLEAKRDEEIKFATENLELPEGKSIDSITKELMSEFNKKGGLSQGSKMPNVEKKIGKWLVDNEYCSDLKDPKLPGIARGLFAAMCRSNLQKTLPKNNTKDPEPEGKVDDTKEGQALKEEAEHKKAVETLIQRVGPQGDLDDPSSVQKEFDEHISKLAKDLKGKYRDEFQEAVKKRKVANIGKGTFKSSDPSKWTEEIKECTNRSELEKMKAAFEKYIDSSDEKVRDGMRKRLDDAYNSSKALKPINNVVKDIVDEILSNSNPKVYDSNKDDFQKRFDGALPEGTSDEQKSKLYSRIRHAAEVRKIMNDDFSSIPAADIREPVGIARLGDEVVKRTAKGEKGLIEKYEKILNFRFPPEEFPSVSIPDMMRRLKENIAKEEEKEKEKEKEKLNPPPATKSESSIRDLFRSRNPDWE